MAPARCPACSRRDFRAERARHLQTTRECQICHHDFVGGEQAKTCRTCRPNFHRQHLLVLAERRRRYRWTPELDALLRRDYDGRVRLRAAAIARRLGWPTWVIKRHAQELGLTCPADRREFTKAEVDYILNWTGERPSGWIAKHLHRSLASIVLKQKRMKICRRVRRGYTVHELCLCFGVDHRVIDRWIADGKLTAHRLGTSRPSDTWRVEDEEILRFIQRHPLAFRLDKVDQVWFLDLITAGGLMRRALAAAKGAA